MQKEFEAVTDEVGPSTSVLTRTVSLGKGSKNDVDLEWNNQAGDWCDPGTLTTSDFCATSFNQQIWIDLQPVGADPFLKGGRTRRRPLAHGGSTATKQGKTKLRFDLGKLSGKSLPRGRRRRPVLPERRHRGVQRQQRKVIKHDDNVKLQSVN